MGHLNMLRDKLQSAAQSTTMFTMTNETAVHEMTPTELHDEFGPDAAIAIVRARQNRLARCTICNGHDPDHEIEVDGADYVERCIFRANIDVCDECADRLNGGERLADHLGEAEYVLVGS